MKKIFAAVTFMLLLSPAITSLAQVKSSVINGKVISFEESFPLEGVRVYVKGTPNITGTQSDGSFTLELKPGDSILVFSREGYETQEVKISSEKKEYTIVLKSGSAINSSANFLPRTFSKTNTGFNY